MQLTATTIVRVTAIPTIPSVPSSNIIPDYIFQGIYTVDILDIKGIYSFLKTGKNVSIDYVLVSTCYRIYVVYDYILKKVRMMNKVILYGRIVSKINFKFIYNRYKSNEKCKNTSIVSFKIELLNKSIVEIYGYDEIADYVYRKLNKNDFILIDGKIDSSMRIELLQVL